MEELVSRYATMLAPCLGAAVGFNATLLGWQGAGKLLGVSCATPVAGSLLGALAVASASVVAAETANVLEARIQNKKMAPLSQERIILHAALGSVAFKALGGRYKNVMPSNLSYPGALARASLPAKGSRYATDGEALVIRELFNKYGCHHCGSTKGLSIADHMPPNVLVRGRVAENMLRKKQQLPYFYKAIVQAGSRLLRRIRNLGLQRFYPQCEACMKKQSAALRHGKSRLVLHFKKGFPEPPYLTGFVVGTLKLDSKSDSS